MTSKKRNPIITLINNILYLTKHDLRESNLSLANKIIKKAKYEIKSEWDNIKVPKIKDSFETLEVLLNSNKSLIRFGDGEFEIMRGNSIPFQNYDENLSKSLREIFYDNSNSELLSGAPYEFFHNAENLRFFNQDYMYNYMIDNMNNLLKFYNFDKEYYSTTISQIYPLYENYDFEKHYSMLKSLFKDKKITLITGNRVLNNLEFNVLEEATSVNYIYGPTKHAYSEINSLREEVSKVEKDNILVFAIGPCGKVLGCEMFKQGYRVLDIGHSIKDYDTYKKSVTMDKNEVRKFFKPD